MENNLVASENKLQFRIPTSNWINSVVIEYDYNKDHYIMEFWKIRWIDCDNVNTIDCVYFDQLVELFEKETGLACSL